MKCTLLLPVRSGSSIPGGVLSSSQPHRSMPEHLRSVNCQLLNVPCYPHNTIGHRAFAVAGSTVWNLLPESVTIAQALIVSCLHWRHFCLHKTSTERIRG